MSHLFQTQKDVRSDSEMSDDSGLSCDEEPEATSLIGNGFATTQNDLHLRRRAWAGTAVQLPSSAWAPPVCLLRLVRCWISDWRRSSVGIFTCFFLVSPRVTSCQISAALILCWYQNLPCDLNRVHPLSSSGWGNRRPFLSSNSYARLFALWPLTKTALSFLMGH